MADEFKNIPKTLTDSQLIYHAVKFDVRSTTIPGKNGRTIRRDAIIHPGAVVILPLLTSDTIVMIRNERFVVDEILWELPAGTLEENEAPQTTAGRELIEETGYQAEIIQPLTSFYTSPGICNEIMHAYVAKNLVKVGQKLEETEKITTEALNWKEISRMIRNGTIRDAKTIATLLFFQAYHSL